jgi:hypothetical protein
MAIGRADEMRAIGIVLGTMYPWHARHGIVTHRRIEVSFEYDVIANAARFCASAPMTWSTS